MGRAGRVTPWLLAAVWCCAALRAGAQNGTNLPANVSANLPANVSANVSANVPANVSANVPANVSANVPTNGSTVPLNTSNTSLPSPAKQEDELTQFIDALQSKVNTTYYGCNFLEGLKGCNDSYSATDIGVSALINFVLGSMCFLGFGVLRKHVKVYKARLCSPATAVKPRRLPEGGVLQIVSWILPVMRLSDESLLQSAGLDALMFSRFLMFCVQFFVPVGILSVGVLLPIHYTATSSSYNWCGYENVIENQDELLRTTLSNMCPGDYLLWVHFVFVYLVMAWAMWLLDKHYIAYTALRHHYVGMPQRPNIWAEKYMVHLSRSPISAHESPPNFSTPKPSPFDEPMKKNLNESKEFMASVEEKEVEAPSEQTPMKRSKSITDVIFNPSKWKDVAKAWVMPDKLLDYEGEEAKDLQRFASKVYRQVGDTPYSKSPGETGPAISTFNGEEISDASPGDGEMGLGTSLPVACAPTCDTDAFPRDSMAEYEAAEDDKSKSKSDIKDIGTSTLSIVTTPSIAAIKWWELYQSEGSKGSCQGPERMVRPSVRHIQAVNTVCDGRSVAVNAAQYAVLVTDIPTNDAEIHTIRRSLTQGSGSSHDDEDAVKIDPVDDICTEVFQTIFPQSFRHVVPVKNFSEVTRLLIRWEQASRKLEVFEALFKMDGVRRQVKDGCLGMCGPKYDAIAFYQNKVQCLAHSIKSARKRLRAVDDCRARFVIFDNQVDAAIAAQSVLLPLDGTKFITQRAPSPDNINWLTLFKTSNERFVRRIMVIPFIVVLIVFPAGFFSASMSVLDAALCQEGSDIYWTWYCYETNNTTFGKLLKRIVTGWLPSILIAVWQNVVVTRVLYIISLAECLSPSLDGLDRRITSLYFYWDFFNIFLGSVFGASLFTFFGSAVKLTDARVMLETLGQAISSSANFLTSYVLMRSLFLVPLKLVFPHPQVLCFVLRNVLGTTCCKSMRSTRRERYTAWEPKSFMYGRESGTSMLMSLIGVAYVSSSPITVAIVALYFTGMYVVCRHHLLYVYARSYESGGELWPVLFDRFVIMLGTLAYFTGAQLVTKRAWSQAVILFLTTPPILFWFHRQCSRKYRDVSKNVPLDIAWRQPCAEVKPQIYIPSELRSQSVGWHPEQGKAWQGYGMPRWM